MRRSCPNVFLAFVVGMAALLWAHQVFVLWVGLGRGGAGRVCWLLWFSLVFAMAMWSLAMSSCGSPGRVPFKWGYYLDDEQVRRRKFCMICQVFKPERSHHCSTCGQCVLNMDHHCPWINNCIGFYNRKPFILMLLYSALALLQAFVGLALSIPAIADRLDASEDGLPFKMVLLVLGALLEAVLLVMVVTFTKFHLELLFNNLTTIEILEQQRSASKEGVMPQSGYDIGALYNFQQVFGRNKLFWLVPIFPEGEGPVGDGVLWPKLS